MSYPRTQVIRQERREAALARIVIRTPQEQVDVLDRRLGRGTGAVRERTRLAAKIAGVPQA